MPTGVDLRKRDIPLKAAEFGTSHWTVPEGRGELGCGEGFESIQVGRQGHIMRLKRGFVALLSVDIIGTDVETIVTAKDPIANVPGEIIGYRAGIPEFDGEVGNAATCVDDIRLGNRASRACLYAEGTAPTEIGSRFVRGELERGQDFSQQQPRPELR